MPEQPAALPRFTVIGAGAMGLFFAAKLAHAGFPVGLVARGDRLARIARDGVQMQLSGTRQTIHVAVAGHAADLPPPDLAIIATKTFDLEDAARQLEGCVAAGPGVLTVQNGVEAPGIVSALLPDAKVIAARVHGFFEMEGDVVRHVGVEPSVALGSLEHARSRAAERFAASFDTAAIACSQPADMASVLWEKFLLAATIGGVGAALGVPVGQLKNDPAHWRMLGDAMAEVATLAASRGVTLRVGCVDTTLAFVSGFPPSATSSLQRDLMAGVPSEYAHLTGAVIRLAAETGLSVPTHQKVARLLGMGG